MMKGGKGGPEWLRGSIEHRCGPGSFEMLLSVATETREQSNFYFFPPAEFCFKVIVRMLSTNKLSMEHPTIKRRWKQRAGSPRGWCRTSFGAARWQVSPCTFSFSPATKHSLNGLVGSRRRKAREPESQRAALRDCTVRTCWTTLQGSRPKLKWAKVEPVKLNVATVFAFSLRSSQ